MCTVSPPGPTDSARADAMVERVFSSVLAAFDIYAISLGDRLGYYRALQEHGSQSPAELAENTQTNKRYAREWLEQQAVSGFLEVDAVSDDDDQRTYRLPSELAPVFVEAGHPLNATPMARLMTGAAAPFEALVTAFRTGNGVPYEEFGVDLMEGQAAMNRPQFELGLGSEWIAAMPDIEARLKDANNPAKIADIGMGMGWSSIAFAKAFPNAIVDGFDLDEASVEAGKKIVAEQGVTDRVTLQVRDAGDPDLAGKYDLATAFECIHDMWDPVSVLASMRRLVGPGGTVLIMDESVADEFGAIGDDVERFMYGFSFLHCLPVGMVKQPSAETGTVMRESTFRRYAGEAGYQKVEVLPIANDFFKFYRLTA